MRRREFIGGLGAAAVWPLAAWAQSAGKSASIGFLASGTPTSHGQWFATFVQRLRDFGWLEGRNITIEVRWAEGRNERAAEIAAEFIRLKVGVIVTTGTPATVAAKRATADVPIIFVAAADPVGGGLVPSLARPGGNVTGISNQQTDVATKRLELFREIVPGLRRLGSMVNVGNPTAMPDMREVRAAARTLGIDVATEEIRRAEDIGPAFDAFTGQVDGLYLFSDLLVMANLARINTLAQAARLPTMYGFREQVAAGGLISYGANLPDLYRRAAEYMDKILRGAKPADIPVEQPTKFDLVINLTTAKALSIAVPPTLLARADEVIE